MNGGQPPSHREVRSGNVSSISAIFTSVDCVENYFYLISYFGSPCPIKGKIVKKTHTLHILISRRQRGFSTLVRVVAPYQTVLWLCSFPFLFSSWAFPPMRTPPRWSWFTMPQAISMDQHAQLGPLSLVTWVSKLSFLFQILSIQMCHSSLHIHIKGDKEWFKFIFWSTWHYTWPLQIMFLLCYEFVPNSNHI